MAESVLPRWYYIPIRILLVTFVVTLISFALSLLLGILGVIVVSWFRGVHSNMALAYRMIALPVAALVGAVTIASSTIMEVRHYRQTRALGHIAGQMQATR